MERKMAVNKLTITINSRQYTVVAQESTQYIERLCNHINEKVENVIRGGQNIMGERPIVLAALNICDEYFKKSDEFDALEKTAESLREKNSRLSRTADSLQAKLDTAGSSQISIGEDTTAKLGAANNRIKFLENQVKTLEGKLRALEGRSPKYDQNGFGSKR